MKAAPSLRAILDKLGVVTLEGRGDDDMVTYVATRARGRFVTSGGKYRFPRRRCCLLLGPRKDDVLSLLGERICCPCKTCRS